MRIEKYDHRMGGIKKNQIVLNQDYFKPYPGAEIAKNKENTLNTGYQQSQFTILAGPPKDQCDTVSDPSFRRTSPTNIFF